MKFERYLQSTKRKEPAGRRRYNDGAFSTESRKGRVRNSPMSRPGDRHASGGDAFAGNAKSKEPRSIGESLKDTLKSSDLRSFALICVTACFSLLVLQFVGSDETYAHFSHPSVSCLTPTGCCECAPGGCCGS